MWVLLSILIVFGLSLMLITYVNRKRKPLENIEVIINMDEECCGAHEVCEHDSLLNSNDEIIYFDDEELDELTGIEHTHYTVTQTNKIADVFYTLQEKDVAGWLRSLQLRNIDLPEMIKEEALLIVSERRMA